MKIQPKAIRDQIPQEVPFWGLLSSIDLYECQPSLIRSKDKIKEYVVLLCDLIKMRRFGETVVVHFGEEEKVAGYSMVQLIETSLISGHFANLTNSAYLDVFSCKSYDPRSVETFSRQFFKAKRSVLHVVTRMGRDGTDFHFQVA